MAAHLGLWDILLIICLGKLNLPVGIGKINLCFIPPLLVLFRDWRNYREPIISTEQIWNRVCYPLAP